MAYNGGQEQCGDKLSEIQIELNIDVERRSNLVENSIEKEKPANSTSCLLRNSNSIFEH